MDWRMFFGWVMALGLVILIWDLVTIGRFSTKKEDDQKLTLTKIKRPENTYPTEKLNFWG
jgi:predicted MFS family arabinose efflux permease